MINIKHVRRVGSRKNYQSMIYIYNFNAMHFTAKLYSLKFQGSFTSQLIKFIRKFLQSMVSHFFALWLVVCLC